MCPPFALILALTFAAAAHGQVVINMPPPKGIPAAPSEGGVTADVGAVALDRYAYGRAGPLYSDTLAPWWGFPYRGYSSWGYGRGYGWGYGRGFGYYSFFRPYGLWGYPGWTVRSAFR